MLSSPRPHLRHQPRVVAVAVALGVPLALLNLPLELLFQASVVTVVASMKPADVAVPVSAREGSAWRAFSARDRRSWKVGMAGASVTLCQKQGTACIHSQSSICLHLPVRVVRFSCVCA